MLNKSRKKQSLKFVPRAMRPLRDAHGVNYEIALDWHMRAYQIVSRRVSADNKIMLEMGALRIFSKKLRARMQTAWIVMTIIFFILIIIVSRLTSRFLFFFR